MKQDTVRATNSYMSVNVILTFDRLDRHGESQEVFDVSLPVSAHETDAISFLNEKLFKRIVKKCEQYNRNVGDLIKISTCGNWNIFEQTTGLKSLCEFDHDCKWYFGTGRRDLDAWEKMLMSKFGFGLNVDMSRVHDDAFADAIMKAKVTALLEQIKQDQTKKSLS